MIEFLTLFLNLVSGVHDVELAVSPQVAVVEIDIDHRKRHVLDGPPWTFTLDLGTTLEPHLLEAVARDGKGRELARTSQAINLPREPAEVRLAVEHDEAGRPFAVRVAWAVSTDISPSSVSVRCDEHTLERDEQGLYKLPTYDMDMVHIISAELRFPGQLSATAQATLGGVYGSDVRSALTAVPVQPPTGVSFASKDVTVRPSGDEHALQVVAVEQPGARLFVIMDPRAFLRLRRYAAMLDGRRLRGFPRGLLVNGDVDDDLAMLVHPCAEMQKVRGEPTWVFPFIGPLTLASHSLPWVLSHARREDLPIEPKRLVDAVATAGVSAAATSAPRAVLLMTTSTTSDSSMFSPAAVQHYLKAIRVPHQVWVVDGSDCEWPEAIDVSSSKKMRAAAGELQSILDSQWIVWVEGNHHPHELEVVWTARPPTGGSIVSGEQASDG